MMRRWAALAGVLTLLGAGVHAAEAPGAATLRLDDFETAPQGWRFVDGAEFPGAKGSLTLDQTVAHGGKASYRLQSDFTGGGAYQGSWRDLASLEGRDFNEIRFWVKAEGVSRLMIRINDATGQCHQRRVPLPNPASHDWQQVVLKVSELVGQEHWDGANDGKWHGPATAFGVNLESGPQKRQTLWMDDLEVTLGSNAAGRATVLPALVNPTATRPGFGARFTFRWDAQPMGRDFTVFVHAIGPDGKMAFTADHQPSVPTSVWKGPVEYSRTVVVPTSLPAGNYRIVVGLYDPRAAKRGWDHQPLIAAKGVTDLSAGEEKGSYQVGALKIDANAPLPKLPPRTLDLNGYKMTFNEEFNELSVAGGGKEGRWFPHTPYFGDFGDARFMDPKEGFPFTVQDGKLRIEARKTPEGWQSGLLSSMDPKGGGFAQKFGYFEMRARFPRGLGMWPAFWLMGARGIKDKSVANPEIDVIEYYGAMPNAMMMTQHLWGPGDKHWAEGDAFIFPGMTDDFHNYGVMVDEKHVTWYFDGAEVWRRPTPEGAKAPLYLMVNLALGGGWPIDQAPSPAFMLVDHVRAYAKER